MGCFPAFGTPQATLDRLVVKIDPFHIMTHGFEGFLDPSQNGCSISLFLGTAQKCGDSHAWILLLLFF
jgi:hypothetical protein